MRKVVKPKASALIMSMRSIGYSLNNAVADIIDNSISAKASKIDIICNWDGNEPFIEIRDDGEGMNADQLKKQCDLEATLITLGILMIWVDLVRD